MVLVLSSLHVVFKIQPGSNVHDDHVNNDHVDHVNDHQVEASCPGSQFVHGGQQFALETRSISGDVDLPQFQFKTANFQPQGDHTGGVDGDADKKRENWKKSNFLRKQLTVSTFSCNGFLILKIWTTTSFEKRIIFQKYYKYSDA